MSRRADSPFLFGSSVLVLALLLDVLANDLKRGAATRGRKIGWTPQAAAPELLAYLGMAAFADHPARYAFQAIHQCRDRHFRRIGAEDVNMVVLAVEFEQFAFEVLAYRRHDRAHLGEDGLREDAAPVFGDKDQVHVNVEYAMASGSYVLPCNHRPSIILVMSEVKLLRLQAYKFRLREKHSQAALMRRYAGCRRKVWNLALAEQQARRERGEKYANYYAMANWITAWRKDPELAYLSEAPVHALQEAVKALGTAFQRFFSKEAGYPKFKRKTEFEGFRETDVKCFAVDVAHSRIKLPKLGWIRFRQSREIIGTPKNVTVSRERGGWFVSIQTEAEVAPLPGGTKIAGLDRGVTNFYATSDGVLKAPLNAHRTLAAKLKRYQRAVSRRMEAAKRAAGIDPKAPFPKGFRIKKSNRLRRAESKVQRLHATIGRVRNDWLHKESTKLADQHAVIVVEDLKIKNMSASAKGTAEAPGRRIAQKSGLNKSILDQGWGEFGRQIEYKLNWRGGELIKVNPAYTSQTCSACGAVAAENRHGEKFLCVACGHEAHADIQAAQNILAAGHAVLAGERSRSHADVEDSALSGRPVRAKARGKRQPARPEGGAPCAA